MPRRIDLGRAVLFAGSALLFIALFMHWFELPGGNAGLSGWQVFETLDLVLAALAVAGVFAALRPDATAPWAAAGVPGAALVIVFVQLVNHPPAAAGTDVDVASGAWVAFAGTILMAAGAALSLAAISITVSVREHDIRRRVAAVDRRGDAEEEPVEDEAAPAARGTSLFGSLGHRDEEEDDVREPDTPPTPTDRFTPRDASGEEQAAATLHRAASASRADDLERTQPLAGLPDDDGDDTSPR